MVPYSVNNVRLFCLILCIALFSARSFFPPGRPMRIDGPSIGLPIIQFVSAGSGSVCGWVRGINVSLQTVLSWPFQNFKIVFRWEFKLKLNGLVLAVAVLAILAMDRFERNNIYDTIRPVVYVRYVDDIGTVVSSIPEANQLLEALGPQQPAPDH